MIATIAASTGINVSGYMGADGAMQQTGGYLYSSPAADIGKGQRSDPNMSMPVWTPGPGAYDTRMDAHDNHAPKFK